MYILKPVAHDTIWGGQKLKQFTVDSSMQLGHLYMVSGRKDMSNIILNGSKYGMTLQELFNEKKHLWNMERFEEFPLTIALVDANENLSIQVHPDDEAAEQIEHKRIGKTESWVFLEPPLSGWIYAGCKCASTEMIKAAISNNEMEQITDRLDITKNDYVCVAAGTLHAMTAGSLVYEIEYGSDYTYRFYDYNRTDKNGNARELHIEKAIRSIYPEKHPAAKSFTGGNWIREKYYELCRLKDICGYKNNSSTVECISLLKGNGTYDNCSIKSGMSILLLPGEILTDITICDAIAARLRVTDEKEN
ncbi:MAG: hypothetical protein HFI77_07695 [Lachnospiraceae bacterium]|uniref:type I phosphomannose isomerase catalytic subunit n=1 Tax=Roseburia sp. 1XD42-69 TaxID=2320088 RepID=UPI000EA35F15|nr:type I phosphomannose isomerase catalytic subunit [Roseburia sp. 1XD42-69]MCI8875923.1 hypothetical protein [Lachnospiraceae bacterium]RKJ66359.1 hypothetical protein D7Y06_07900 [Roseburia sp. 1XD42-69]